MVRLTDRPDMTYDVYRERKTTTKQQQHQRQNERKIKKQNAMARSSAEIGQV